MDEQQLERVAQELGRRRAEAVDPEATARAVLHRLRTEPLPSPWWRRLASRPRHQVVQFAGAAVIIVVAVLGIRQLAGPGAAQRPLAAPPELQDLATTELAEVLDSLEAEMPVHELVSVSLYDLSESELSALLEDLEG